MDEPVRVNRPHAKHLRAIVSWQAHICGEEEPGEALIGITFFDAKDVAFADTHMTLEGACTFADVLLDVIASYRKKIHAVNN